MSKILCDISEACKGLKLLQKSSTGPLKMQKAKKVYVKGTY